MKHVNDVPKKRHPIQPLSKDASGVWRFKSNKIIRYLIENGSVDLNQIAEMDFPKEDREQLMQLLGYSLNGFSELSFVRYKTYSRAVAKTRAKAKTDPELLRLIEDAFGGTRAAFWTGHPDIIARAQIILRRHSKA